MKPFRVKDTPLFFEPEVPKHLSTVLILFPYPNFTINFLLLQFLKKMLYLYRDNTVKGVFMLGIKDAIKRIFYGGEALYKHIVIFALAGIPAILATPLNEISKRNDIDLQTVLFSLLLLIISCVAFIYLTGYMYGLTHNSFDNEEKSILPDFEKKWFGIFFKALPLQIVWLLYISVALIVFFLLSFLFTPLFGYNIAITISMLLMIIFTVIIALALPLIFAQFSKNYESKGLYKFSVAFNYLKKTYSCVLWLFVKLLPIQILIGVLSFFGEYNNVFAYICNALGAYLSTIVLYISCFCYVQIYKEQIENFNE